MEPYIAEFIGTALLLLLGSGVVANVLLEQSKGQNGGWLVICWAWAIAVFLGVYTATHLGGSGHLNPAVTLALAAFGGFDSALVPGYITAQVLGALTGSSLAWLTYRGHFDASRCRDDACDALQDGWCVIGNLTRCQQGESHDRRRWWWRGHRISR